MRTFLESEPSSGEKETLDLNPLSLDSEDRAAVCLSVSQQEGSAKMSMESEVCRGDIFEHVLADGVSPEKWNVGQSKTSISRTDVTNRASSTEATQPQNDLNCRGTGRKTFFTELRGKSLPVNENLLEYFRLPIPSKLHLRSHIAAKSKEMSRASINNVKRTSKRKENCRPMTPPLSANSPPVHAVFGPLGTFPQTRFSTLTSRSSRPYFLAPKNKESLGSKSVLQSAPMITVSTVPPVKMTDLKNTVSPPHDTESDAGSSHKNSLGGINTNFTDSSDSMLSCYLLPALILTRGT
jgi:hypothetical protein